MIASCTKTEAASRTPIIQGPGATSCRPAPKRPAAAALAAAPARCPARKAEKYLSPWAPITTTAAVLSDCRASVADANQPRDAWHRPHALTQPRYHRAHGRKPLLHLRPCDPSLLPPCHRPAHASGGRRSQAEPPSRRWLTLPASCRRQMPQLPPLVLHRLAASCPLRNHTPAQIAFKDEHKRHEPGWRRTWRRLHAEVGICCLCLSAQKGLRAPGAACHCLLQRNSCSFVQFLAHARYPNPHSERTMQPLA